MRDYMPIGCQLEKNQMVYRQGDTMRVLENIKNTGDNIYFEQRRWAYCSVCSSFCNGCRPVVDFKDDKIYYKLLDPL